MAEVSSILGINIRGVEDWQPEFIWKDIMPNMRVEGATSGAAFVDEQFDANGYPLYLLVGQQINFGYGAGTNYAWPIGDYHIFYTGEGTIINRTTNETFVSDDSNGHQVWSIAHNSEWFGFSITAVNASNPITNIKIIMPGYESTYVIEPLHPSFVSHWSIFKAFRYMDMQGTGSSRVVDWADIRSEGFINQLSDSAGENSYLPMSTIHWGTSVAKMVEMSNIMQKDAWFCIPHQASDSCIKAFAEYVRDNLDSNLKVYVEWSNEVWNPIAQQFTYAAAQGLAVGISDGSGSLEYYVYRSGQMYDIWRTAFGAGASTRLVCVFSWQSVDTFWYKVAFDTYFPSTTYNPSVEYPDYYAIAPYFNIWDTNESTTEEDLFTGIFSESLINYNLATQEATFIDRKSEMDSRGYGLCCYEAGQHLVTPVTPSIDANRDARMGTAFTQYLNSWKNNVNDLMMLYASTSPYGASGSWGLLETYLQDVETAPKYHAVAEFITAEESGGGGEVGDIFIDLDLLTGNNDGSDEANAFQTLAAFNATAHTFTEDTLIRVKSAGVVAERLLFQMYDGWDSGGFNITIRGYGEDTVLLSENQWVSAVVIDVANVTVEDLFVVQPENGYGVSSNSATKFINIICKTSGANKAQAAFYQTGINSEYIGCNAINAIEGFVSGTFAAILINCYAGDCTTCYSGTSQTLTTCASSDATGSAGLQNIPFSTANFVNVTLGGENFNLTEVSMLRNVGTITSYLTDMVGTVRGSTVDVGAYEYPESSGLIDSKNIIQNQQTIANYILGEDNGRTERR